MALVAVLWGLALLSLIAASLAASASLSQRLTRSATEHARAEALAEAGVDRALLALLDGRIEKRWRVDATGYDFVFAGARIRVRIQDELGKIDLNAADEDLLGRLFQSVGLSPDAASSLVDRILDWRDAGELRRLNGAKLAEYRASGLDYGPRNGPFQSVDELKLVLGMTPELFRRVAPALTVYSGRPLVDPNVAPREVLLALPGMDADKVEALLAARSPANGASSDQGGAVAGSGIDPNAATPGRAFTIRAELLSPADNFTREAVIRLTGNPAQPYWVLAWSEAEPEAASR